MITLKSTKKHVDIFDEHGDFVGRRTVYVPSGDTEEFERIVYINGWPENIQYLTDKKGYTVTEALETREEKLEFLTAKIKEHPWYAETPYEECRRMAEDTLRKLEKVEEDYWKEIRKEAERRWGK